MWIVLVVVLVMKAASRKSKNGKMCKGGWKSF